MSDTLPRPISEFIKDYHGRLSYYEGLAKYVKGICEEYVTSRACEAIVTYRAKTVQSLRDKLVNRNDRRSYKKLEDVRADVKDLVGVRISLFFPHHRDLVHSFVEENFHVKERINNPGHDEEEQTGETGNHEEEKTGETGQRQKYKNRFRGYEARHFRVTLSEKTYKTEYHFDSRAEIQVMTVLHSAWAEVEHSISYKKLEGDPSDEECRILDGLNGLMTMGELYLEQLNKTFEERIAGEKDRRKPFANKYELGAFLSSQMREQGIEEKFEMSSVHLLRKFLGLQEVKRDSKEKLKDEISKIKDDTTVAPPLTRDDVKGRPNVTLILMAMIYFDEKNHLRKKARKVDPKSKSDKERCEILMSTIITLDELFPPEAFWLKELTDQKRKGAGDCHTHGLKCLKWLMSTQGPKNIILGHRTSFAPEDKTQVMDLWNWLKDHPSEFVQFVFSISRLGVLRDLLRDLALLQRILKAVDRLF